MRYLSLSLLFITVTTMHGMFSLKQMSSIAPRIAAVRFINMQSIVGPLYDTCSCQVSALPDNWNPIDQKEFEEAVLTGHFAVARDKLIKSGAFLFHRVDPHMHHNFGPDILQQALDSLNIEAARWLIDEHHFIEGNLRGRYVDSLLHTLQKLRAEEEEWSTRARDWNAIKADMQKGTTLLSMVVHAEYGCYGMGNAFGREISETAKKMRDAELDSLQEREIVPLPDNR